MYYGAITDAIMEATGNYDRLQVSYGVRKQIEDDYYEDEWDEDEED